MRTKFAIITLVIALLALNAVMLLQKDSFAQDQTVEERLQALEEKVTALEKDINDMANLVMEFADEIALLGVKTAALEDAVSKK